MGRIDAITNEYMSDNERFADVFNFFLYKGKQVIDPAKLREMDRTAIALPYGDDSKKSDVIQKYRDVFKMLAAMEDDNAAYLLLGVEDQTHVHYAMPARNMLYDAAQYVQQAEKTARVHRKNKDIKDDEFLSGFAKDDKLLPVITLVIYWSPDEWDGPRCIHEMLSAKDDDILQYVPDYKINLITPKEISDNDFDKFQTSLAEVFQFVKYSKDKTVLKDVVERDKSFEHLDRRTVEVINEVTGSDISIPEGAKEVNMCQALEDMKREATKQATDKTLVDDIKKLMKNLKLTAEQAMDALEIAMDDRKHLTQML